MNSNNQNAHHSHAPYWKRAHRDWRVWIGVVLILVAMIVYIMSGDFGFLSHSRPQP